MRAARRAGRTDAPRAALILWGSWLVVTLLTFSLMAGIFHAYYTVALAPAIAAVIGIGTALLWERRAQLWSLALLAGITLATAGWAFVLLGRNVDWLPWLRWVVLAAGILGAVGLLGGHRAGARCLTASALVAILMGLAGPTAYTLQTVTTAHSGSIVSAGPAVTGGMGGPQGGARGGIPGGAGLPGNMRPGGTAGALGAPSNGGTAQPGRTGPTTAGGTTGGATDGGRGMGGLLNGSQVDAKVTALLLNDADSYTWVAATVGANNASSYQLASERSVMPIGGFNGSDPSPTLTEFKTKVSAGQIHYFISGAGGGIPSAAGGSNAAGLISAWVTATFTAQTVDGVKLYDLTQPVASGPATTTAATTTRT